uniref:Uncharacterized protein n=1 Tax=Engystomops pustulosus TaxID=76066 RepID=A0AAV6YT57_ENGPU|nr:hypothetical protein GDO81_019211 [Engystomops pustulosus]
MFSSDSNPSVPPTPIVPERRVAGIIHEGDLLKDLKAANDTDPFLAHPSGDVHLFLRNQVWSNGRCIWSGSRSSGYQLTPILCVLVPLYIWMSLSILCIFIRSSGVFDPKWSCALHESFYSHIFRIYSAICTSSCTTTTICDPRSEGSAGLIDTSISPASMCLIHCNKCLSHSYLQLMICKRLFHKW